MRLRVERLDARFEALVPADADVDVLVDLGSAEGGHWLEGPVWDRRNECLLFSDVKANAIYRWDPRDGLRLFMPSSGYTGPDPAPMDEPGSNSLAFDRDGRLLICEQGTGASPASSRTAARRCSPTTTRANDSTAPTISSVVP